MNKYKMIDGHYKCITCDEKFKALGSYKSHLTSYDHFYYTDNEDGLNQCYCAYCDLYLETIAKAEYHRKGVCPKNKRCELCNRTFATKQAKEKHKCRIYKKHSPKSLNKTFKPRKRDPSKQLKHCKLCNKDFATHGSFSRHIKTKHMPPHVDI